MLLILRVPVTGDIAKDRGINCNRKIIKSVTLNGTASP